jgi:DNA-binding transcriptional regulator YdaS (Cro superfamily)
VKEFKMIGFDRWVQEIGGRAEAARLMAVDPAQITRWVNAGAVLSKDGTLFVPSAAEYTRPPTE